MPNILIIMMLLIIGCNQVSGADDIRFLEEKNNPDTETDTDTQDAGADTGT